ncbi:S-layer protein domain-containing protein [Methanococcoides sp. LMO-2]|uniref:S-layer protein domain-containing protein n=1 Tax=Methanococcoides cohabitans TaxID=3136559 RepID=A0ABU9KPP8_9EURY
MVVISTQIHVFPEDGVENDTGETMDEVHIDEQMGEELVDENLSERGIVVGDCFGATYSLRNGDVIKLSDDHELTVKHIDGINEEVLIELSENGRVIDDEYLSASLVDPTWDICVSKENESLVYKANLKYIFQYNKSNVAVVHISFPSPIPEEEVPRLESPEYYVILDCEEWESPIPPF